MSKQQMFMKLYYMPSSIPCGLPKKREREIEVFHKVLVHFKSLVTRVINVVRKFWKLFSQTLIETKAKFIIPMHSYFGPSSGYQTNLSGWLNWNPISCDNFGLVSTTCFYHPKAKVNKGMNMSRGGAASLGRHPKHLGPLITTIWPPD